MKRVFIAAGVRTAIGKMGGTLSDVTSVEIGSRVIEESVKRANIDLDKVDHVILGCVLQAGCGQNIARQASLKAGLPNETTAETINMVCGSGLHAINIAARLIKIGEADVVVAGGVENMSQAPYLLKKARFGYRMGNQSIIDSMINDGLWDAMNDYHMGITAENICSKYNIKRKELDDYSYNSQKKAQVAISSGKFKDEIVPISIKTKKENIVFDEDECLRFDTSFEGLSKLKPAFKDNGLVTAGNSSVIGDGGAACVLVSEDFINSGGGGGATPLFEWLDGVVSGVDPEIMGIGPVFSTRKLLNKLNMNIDDIDLIELNEAFAAQSIAVIKELNLNSDIVNVNGGAIALGHPIGASGCRILVSLMHEMTKRESNIGLASLCVGGGMGCSSIVKRVV